MEKTEIINKLCILLLEDRKGDCIDLANSNYPFTINSTSKRKYSKHEMCKCFLNDGFIDRYSGKKLLFPGLLMILSLELPDIFKYHRNWKMSETHSIYWELFPTIDYLIPVARGGEDNEDNWITTSMIRNSAKSNWTIEELGWNLHDKGNLNEWDGLVNQFLELYKCNPDLEQNKYVVEWKSALFRAMKQLL
jgi:hypothetical protein